MNRVVSTMMMMALTASLAHAQSSTDASTQGQAAGNANGNGAAVSTDAQTQASLVENSSADAAALQKQIEAKGEKVSAKARARADAKLETTTKEVDAAAAQGESKVAGRLATEFGMTSDALMAEKSSTGASWGGLMIAHTLAANATTSTTVASLLSMHQGGMGWGQIAAGMGLNLGEVISAVKAEGKVAGGEAKADGKVAVIHGQGAKAGLGLGAKSGVAGGKVNATAGVGAGIKVKP